MTNATQATVTIELSVDAQIEQIAAKFAKENKVSRAKVLQLLTDVYRTSRPRTKRDEYHAAVLQFAEKAGGIFNRAQLVEHGIENAAFATKTLAEAGKIIRLPFETKIKDGKGRGAVTYCLPEAYDRAMELAPTV